MNRKEGSRHDSSAHITKKHFTVDPIESNDSRLMKEIVTRIMHAQDVRKGEVWIPAQLQEILTTQVVCISATILLLLTSRRLTSVNR